MIVPHQNFCTLEIIKINILSIESYMGEPSAHFFWGEPWIIFEIQKFQVQVHGTPMFQLQQEWNTKIPPSSGTLTPCTLT